MAVEVETRVQLLPGPVPSVIPTSYDLADLGYVEEEYLLEGRATSYALVGARTADGRWEVDEADAARYRTRLIVRRPVDAATFSGTVLVEWLNVSGGLDAAPDWSYVHRHLVRRGDAWVGVSAQKAGIDGGGLVETLPLKVMAPERYAQLDHPGDTFAFDIFTQAGEVVRGANGVSPLGELRPRLVLASGESQSAIFLVTYINAIDAHARVFDGFFIHGRGAVGAGFGGPTATGAAELAATAALSDGDGEQIRSDARVPVTVVQSETDVVFMRGAAAAQPDSDRVRQWEIAGAAHADTYMLIASGADDGTLPPATLAKKLEPIDNFMGLPTGAPINAGPQQHYVAQAALEHLQRWAGGGDAPATADRLDVADGAADLVRDSDGIATGGLRTPWVDVPVNVLSGLGQSGGGFAILFGTTAPLPPGGLAARYPGGRDDYLEQFTAALDRSIAAGYLLEDDRAEILAVASATFDLLD